MFISVDLPAPFSPSSACTSPRRTSSDTSSLATTPGNSLRMPRISRTSSSLTLTVAMLSPVGGRAKSNSPSRRVGSSLLAQRGRRRERAGDDLRLVLVHQVLPRLRHRRADRADADAVVLQVERDVLAARPVSGLREADRGLDTDVRLLGRAGEDLRRDVVLVDVDADAPLAELRRFLERTVAAEACDLEDDLGSGADLVLRHRRASTLIGEAVRVLGRRLRARYGLVRAVLIPGDVRVDRRDLDTADRADRAGLAAVHLLGFLRGQNADETADFLRRVGDADLVLVATDGADRIVGDRELDVRVLLRVLLHRVAEQEAGGDDQVGSSVNGCVVVREVVARRM